MYDKNSPYSKGAHCLEKEFADTKSSCETHDKSYSGDKHRNQKGRTTGLQEYLLFIIPCRVPGMMSV